jgi:hypothetical protein
MHPRIEEKDAYVLRRPRISIELCTFPAVAGVSLACRANLLEHAPNRMASTSHIESRTVMASFRCPFCQHPNPEHAKFCNECGNTLGLKPCTKCDAVNAASALECHSCGERFGASGSSSASEDASGPVGSTDPSSVVRALETLPVEHALHEGRRGNARFARPVRASRPRLVAAVVLVIVLGGLYGYRQSTHPGAWIDAQWVRSMLKGADAPTMEASKKPGSALPDSVQVVATGKEKGASNDRDPSPISPDAKSTSAENAPTAVTVAETPLKARDGRPVAQGFIRSDTSSASQRDDARTSVEGSATADGKGMEGLGLPAQSLRVPIAPCTESLFALNLCTRDVVSSGR